MSDSFDAYHKWLGIPPSQQPPNHYRLLGIDVFESDSEVIDVAANQRMSYLQDVAAGPHVELSQKLLNEISSARRCLLNADEKTAYDETLRAEQQASEVAAPAAPDTGTFDFTEPAGSSPVAPTPVDPPQASDQGEREAPAKRKSELSVTWIGGGIISVVSLIIAAVMIFGGGDDDTALLNVKWALNEREGAYVIRNTDVVIESESQLPNEEVVPFRVLKGEHTFFFERDGYREIKMKRSFMPGETVSVELKWRAKR